MKKYLLFILVCAYLTASVSGVEAKISSSSQAHIKQRHWYGANSGPNTSHFNRSMTTGKLDAIATKAIRNGSSRPSTHGQGRQTHQYRFRRPVGTASNGKKANALRVVTDRNGKVVTAFPVQ